MGTNLREPVPANPMLIPQFMPIDHTTPAQRATESATLVAEAGMSARRIGVPLTMQDFPRNPVECKGANGDDPMHSSIPLFGLSAPRWRSSQGLKPDEIPGTAAYNGRLAPPRGKRGLKLYNKRAEILQVPLWKQVEDGVDEFGIGAAAAASGSSTSGARTGASGVPFVRSPFDSYIAPFSDWCATFWQYDFRRTSIRLSALLFVDFYRALYAH